jgi:hypothetical protein
MTSSNHDSNEPSADVLQAKITLETARMRWRELQRFFAAGKVIAVDPSLDLTQVAAELAKDNKAQFQAWLEQDTVAGVSDDEALRWYADDSDVWTVVVAPWVLVQPVAAAD